MINKKRPRVGAAPKVIKLWCTKCRKYTKTLMARTTPKEVKSTCPKCGKLLKIKQERKKRSK